MTKLLLESQPLDHSTTSDVVYVLRHIESALKSEELHVAQQLAIKNELPFCTVYCLEEWDEKVLERLRHIEAELADYAIPLIVLVGNEAKTLPGFIHHTQPLKVFDGHSTQQTKELLVTHPHAWPGKVIGVDELVNLYTNGQISC